MSQTAGCCPDPTCTGDCEPAPARLRIVSDGIQQHTRLTVVLDDGTEVPLSDLVTVLTISFNVAESDLAQVTLEVGDLDLDTQAAIIAVTQQPPSAPAPGLAR